MVTKQRVGTLDTTKLFDRFFAAAKSYHPDELMQLPISERPLLQVKYRDIYELNTARSIAPPYCRVEYVFIPPKTGTHGRRNRAQ
jgi:hypothetical protein